MTEPLHPTPAKVDRMDDTEYIGSNHALDYYRSRCVPTDVIVLVGANGYVAVPIEVIEIPEGQEI